MALSVENSHSIRSQKALLRKELRQKLEALNPAERSRQSGEILKRLFRHPKFLGARSLLAYVALPSEVETRPLVEEAERQGKKVYVPRVDSARKRMAMIELVNFKELHPGPHGILEPAYDPSWVGRPQDLDLVVVPGFGFDREGGRVGRGEGYFDRFLAEAKRAYKIGLAFECQIVERVPREANDMTVDEVLIG